MISCTEYIPYYSEIMKYFDSRDGYEGVKRYWHAIFEPKGDKMPLVDFVEKEGIRGCWTYWNGTLNEEAADFTFYLNEKAGWFHDVMHKCPSKGKLLKLKEEFGYEPYKNYCLHCDYYRLSLNKAGLEYIYNFKGVDEAACSEIIYDPKVFDGRIIIDENTEIQDKRAADNEYWHRGFHNGMSNSLIYLKETYGIDAVKDYLKTATRNVCVPVLRAIPEQGFKAVADKIRDTYRKEHAEDALTITETESELRVRVAYCPAVRFILESGVELADCFELTTSAVMETFAEEGGWTFVMDSYDPETGAAEYHFLKA